MEHRAVSKVTGAKSEADAAAETSTLNLRFEPEVPNLTQDTGESAGLR